MCFFCGVQKEMCGSLCVVVSLRGDGMVFVRERVLNVLCIEALCRMTPTSPSSAERVPQV